MGMFAPARRRMRSDRLLEFLVAVVASKGSHTDVEGTHSSKVFIDTKTIPDPAWIPGKGRKGGIYTKRWVYNQVEAG